MSTLFVFLSLAYLSLAYHKSESNYADKTKKNGCAFNEDSDQPGHQPKSIHGLLQDKTIKDGCRLRLNKPWK